MLDPRPRLEPPSALDPKLPPNGPAEEGRPSPPAERLVLAPTLAAVPTLVVVELTLAVGPALTVGPALVAAPTEFGELDGVALDPTPPASGESDLEESPLDWPSSTNTSLA